MDNKPVKRRRNRPDLKNFGFENVEPGDNTRYLRHALVAFNLPPIDISDPKQVENRLNEYWNYCIENDYKPSVVSMANWLGVNRHTVRSWANGECRGATHSALIKKAYNTLESLWVDYMVNGKVNPASGIFLGKNIFDYKDQQDVVITPNQSITDTTPEAIATEYAQLPDE